MIKKAIKSLNDWLNPEDQEVKTITEKIVIPKKVIKYVQTKRTLERKQETLVYDSIEALYSKVYNASSPMVRGEMRINSKLRHTVRNLCKNKKSIPEEELIVKILEFLEVAIEIKIRKARKSSV